MTDVEIVARAIWRHAFSADAEDWDQAQQTVIWPSCMAQAVAVVAALTEAGRLLPPGCVAIDAGRWERVRRYADVVLDGALCSGDGDVFLTGESYDAMAALMPGDLDAEPR